MNSKDKLIEVAELRPSNIDELAKKTGRSTESLWHIYYNAKAVNKKAVIMVTPLHEIYKERS